MLAATVRFPRRYTKGRIVNGHRSFESGIAASRRSFVLSGWLVVCTSSWSWADGSYQVRIRADDVIRGSMAPIALEGLRLEPDDTPKAQELSKHVPPGRAAPVFVWIVGAMVAPLILQFVREQLRQQWYGGVVIDARSTPIVVTNDQRIPSDMVLVINASEKNTLYRSSDLPAEILEKVLRR